MDWAADVADSILVFDEAHNIEDVSREAASCEVELTTMIEVSLGRRGKAPLLPAPCVTGGSGESRQSFLFLQSVLLHSEHGSAALL